MTGTSWRDRIKVHPAADLFPMMAEDELDVLGRDIKENGLRQPVSLWTPSRSKLYGRKGHNELFLLDGRNRLAAIERAFAADAPQCAEEIEGALYLGLGGARLLYGDDDPYEFVISANIHRRHLSGEQSRDLIANLLKARPEQSDRQIAKAVKASPTTVGKVRADLEQSGDVSRLDTRTDTAGRQQPSTKPPKPSSKLDQIRALRERSARDEEVSRSSAISTDGRFSLVDELRQLLRVLQGDLGRIDQIPLAKRVALARGCLMAFNLTLDDLQPIGDAP
jgi:hypothetical protein